MAVNASVPAVFDALKAKLDARPGLSGVLVRTGMLPDQNGKDSLEIHSVDARNEFVALGNRRIDEDYTITGSIWTHRRGIDDETAIKAARDAAFAVYDELLECLRDDPRIDGNVRQSIGGGYQFVQGFDSEKRTARIEFDITIQNEIRA